MPYAAIKLLKAPLLMYEEYYLTEVNPLLPKLNSYSIIPSAQVGLDVRFPIFSETSGLVITGGAEYMVGVDTFFQAGLGFYVN